MAESKELGTLIVVVGKARNLPNKSRFGKQDPFCTVKVGEEKQRTKAIKRGGQHPEWDEELRFTIMEDVDDVLVRSESQPDTSLASSTSQSAAEGQPGVTTAAALANKSRKGPIGKKGVKSMKVAVYADDAKEPELIGECVVSIEEVLKKGEVDEWYEFLYKEKYSGEVYLELTFYSNNAPPVKRNVPRPSVNAFGGIDPSPSSSSLVGRHRASGGLSVSGSVSGMSLYIPPYVQPARVPSPSPQPNPPTSFAELGLPARKQSLPHPKIAHLGQSPSTHTLVPQRSQNALDSLTRPMASMSLGMSHSSRPLPSATPIPSHLHHATSSHRHSVGGPFEAPWGSLLPQAQPPPTLKPHPRPLSSNDLVPWDQMQRLEEDRRTPLSRPISGQGLSANSRPAQSDPRLPSPFPTSAVSVTLSERRQANSLSPGSGQPGPSSYRQPSPAPTPPLHPNTAPPVPYATSHYQVPTSTYASFSQTAVDPLRMPSPQPGYDQGFVPNQPYDPYRTPTPSNQHQFPPSELDYSDPLGRLPPRGGPHAQYRPPEASRYTYDQNDYHSPTYPPQPSSSQSFSSNSTDPHQYPYSQQGQSPARQPSPAPPVPGGYVPWYQQTQSANQPYPAQGDQQYASGYDQQQNHYASPGIAGPSRRPVPHPPAPQRPQNVGYYPSDELYAQQQSHTPQPAPDTWDQQGYRQSPAQNPDYHSSYQTSQAQPYPLSSSTPSPLPFSPPSRYAPSPIPGPRDPSWQGQPEYQRAPTPQPPPQEYYNNLPSQPFQNPYPAHSHTHPQPPPRVPSPQPPLHHAHSAPDGWQPQLAPPGSSHSSQSFSSRQTPSTTPAKQDWRSYMQNLPSASPSPGALVRSPSPQPPPKDQQTWYTPPPTLPASIRPPEGWRSTLPAQANGHEWRG